MLYSYASTRSTWLFSIDGSEISVKVGGRISSNNGAAICEMAISGLGIILQPDFIVAPHLRSGALEQLFPEQFSETIGIYAVYQSRRHVPARLRLFLIPFCSPFVKLQSDRPCRDQPLNARSGAQPMKEASALSFPTLKDRQSRRHT